MSDIEVPEGARGFVWIQTPEPDTKIQVFICERCDALVVDLAKHRQSHTLQAIGLG